MTKYLIEIKNRIICIIIVSITYFVTITVYKFYIINITLYIIPNIQKASMNYFILTSITELFNAFFKLSFFFTKYTLYYFIYYHVTSFLALGLYKKEYTYLKKFFTKSFLWWGCYTAFYLKTLLPLSYEFFFVFHQKSIEKLQIFFEPKLYEFFDFIMETYSQNFICTQFLLILTEVFNYKNASLTTIKMLKKKLYIGVLFVATFLTPPDITSQLIVFLSLVLYIEAYLIGKSTLLYFKNKA